MKKIHKKMTMCIDCEFMRDCKDVFTEKFMNCKKNKPVHPQIIPTLDAYTLVQHVANMQNDCRAALHSLAKFGENIYKEIEKGSISVDEVEQFMDFCVKLDKIKKLLDKFESFEDVLCAFVIDRLIK